MRDDRISRQVPAVARWLGYAGLLPQVAAVVVLFSGELQWRFTALALGYAYAALIFSFLGGMWWGLAAQAARAPAWLWGMAVVPSLIALVSAIPWAIGAPWPKPSLALLGWALIMALGVDHAIKRKDLCPLWWMALRAPLSLGLGILTLVMTCL